MVASLESRRALVMVVKNVCLKRERFWDVVSSDLVWSAATTLIRPFVTSPMASRVSCLCNVTMRTPFSVLIVATRLRSWLASRVDITSAAQSQPLPREEMFYYTYFCMIYFRICHSSWYALSYLSKLVQAEGMVHLMKIRRRMDAKKRKVPEKNGTAASRCLPINTIRAGPFGFTRRKQHLLHFTKLSPLFIIESRL